MLVGRGSCMRQGLSCRAGWLFRVPRQAAELEPGCRPRAHALQPQQLATLLPGPKPLTPQILTYLKVEPVQWPAARLRRVLNAAIASPISAQAG